jgi:peptidoglycan/xylan/chitin deacetylase (PgdA/CDA1 family)
LFIGMSDFSSLAVVAGAGSAIAFGVYGALYHAAYSVRSQTFGRTVWRGRADTDAVALTFDDGPSDDTEAALDVLKSYDARAAFFMIGREVEKRPAVARRIVAEGHEIGNHSYTHPIYLFCTPARTRDELRRAQDAIARVTGVRPALSRPPCGVRTPAYFAAARELGLQTVQWTAAGFDWQRRSAREIAAFALKDVAAGSIILLHDGDSQLKNSRRETVAALPLIIEGLRERGLRVAPLAEILAGVEFSRETNLKGRENIAARVNAAREPLSQFEANGGEALR